ncbi:MAG: HD domain-containing protein [Bacteroidetes bacterium]|nr:HD domain-containing protein [Bacteroidota bacterium]MBS1632810.1 HD domain-containing protein [Bacteroidota bacterium]
MNFTTIYNDALNRVLSGLSKDLSYHSLGHTLDVLKQSQRIASEEGIRDKKDLFLLKTAALYHDTGFLNSYSGHEEASCEIARKELPAFGLNEKQLETICGMIMATKIPQAPGNKLEEIICDADLDYLGRNDFFEIAATLFSEMKQRGYVHTEREWNQVQVKFLKAHHYFTSANQKARQPKKLQHLARIEQML